MRMDDLLAGVTVLDSWGDLTTTEIGSVTESSATATSGSLYCCVVGANADGHDFAPEAVRRGASGLLVERRLDLPVAQAQVSSVRPAMAEAAAELNGRPSEHMKVVGVTGTNGKTTVTHMLASVLETNGWTTGVLGTLSGKRTTASAPDLQAALAAELGRGAKALAMEVSSHALVQHRVDAVHFAVAVFTNLSQDHLDYHGTMDDYFEAKSRLFRGGRAETAVVNVTGEWGRRLLPLVEGPVVTFSAADASVVEAGLVNTTFRWRGMEIRLPMGGSFNVENALAAATTASVLGVPDEVVADGLSRLAPVRGRLEEVGSARPFSVLVDFAHTPDGLDQVLSSVRATLAPGARLAVVFGCGGERDRAKRPLMGSVASRRADLAVITNDNPRSEDPRAIIEAVRAGADGPAVVEVEPDRRAAIDLAFRWARPGDAVVIAGKGHESGQETAGVTVPFDDATVARELLGQGGGA
ncbi:MAG TPA: UDP-N-acetylmuramoyl-L-alanyl-D-glutamate--2,6-diaminopimelate ligase [Acidimicrobiales bacterium]|nr:UDP-N-acetylmuramoyl-L-alanyl-D-glutamate--2,6-diaminopimelate ligase [Acidimicrobiales bacterium]